MMEEIKMTIRMIVLTLGLFLYIGVWGYLWKNREMMQTGYTYWCTEKLISDLLWMWVTIHAFLVVMIIFWAFS